MCRVRWLIISHENSLKCDRYVMAKTIFRTKRVSRLSDRDRKSENHRFLVESTSKTADERISRDIAQCATTSFHSRKIPLDTENGYRFTAVWQISQTISVTAVSMSLSQQLYTKEKGRQRASTMWIIETLYPPPFPPLLPQALPIDRFVML